MAMFVVIKIDYILLVLIPELPKTLRKKNKINLIMMIHKDNQCSHFDYLDLFGAKYSMKTCSIVTKIINNK